MTQALATATAEATDSDSFSDEGLSASVLNDCWVRSITKSFDNGEPVLRGVNFHVGRGESVALIGSNGAGKSTLLRCCLRLIEPTSGEITLLGETITLLKARQLRALRSQVGFVFQKHNLVGRLSALSNVIHGAQARGYGFRTWYQGFAPAIVREEAMHCLDRVGLAEFADRRADTLSGGQSQRVAIARALMQRPRFFMADEPVASLDPAAGEEVMRLFTELLREDGTTLLYTSHNLRHALEFADRVVALRNGRVELDAETRALDAASLEYVYE